MTEREKLIEAMARTMMGISPDVEESALSETAQRMLMVGRDYAQKALSAIEAMGAVVVPRKTLTALANACETGQVVDKDVIGRLRALAASPYRSEGEG